MSSKSESSSSEASDSATASTAAAAALALRREDRVALGRVPDEEAVEAAKAEATDVGVAAPTPAPAAPPLLALELGRLGDWLAKNRERRRELAEDRCERDLCELRGVDSNTLSDDTEMTESLSLSLSLATRARPFPLPLPLALPFPLLLAAELA